MLDESRVGHLNPPSFTWVSEGNCYNLEPSRSLCSKPGLI